MKLTNGNTGHAQVIGVILCCFPNYYIIYPVGTVYYYPGHPSNTISSGYLNFYVGFQKVVSETLEHCDFVDPQGCYWRPPYQTQNNLDYFQIEIFKVNPRRYRNVVFPTVSALSKQIPDYLSAFGHFSIPRLKLIAIKVLMEVLPQNIPDLEKSVLFFS